MSAVAPRGRLSGRVILHTREAEGGDPLATRLMAEGAQVRILPLTRTEDVRPPSALHEAARALYSDETPAFDWVVFTSARAVGALARAAGQPRPPLRRGRIRWGCVGPATAAALREHFGVTPDLVPDRFDAASLAEGMIARMGRIPVRPTRVLFPAADRARDDLPRALRSFGFDVVRVIAYQTVALPPEPRDWRPPPGHMHWDAVVFTSGFAVEVLVEEVRHAEGGADWLTGMRAAVLGRTAEQALARAGFSAAIRAPRPDLAALAEAIVETLGDPREL